MHITANGLLSSRLDQTIKGNGQVGNGSGDIANDSGVLGRLADAVIEVSVLKYDSRLGCSFDAILLFCLCSHSFRRFRNC